MSGIAFPRIDRGGLGRLLAVELAAVLLILAGYGLIQTAASPWGQVFGFGNGDLNGYLAGAQRFLETGSPYEAAQIAGPWTLGPRSFIHPPSALPLFVPFLILPAVLWWAIPLTLTAYCLWRLRPAPWTWPVMAACLVWPRSAGSLIAGNTDMWAMAFVAAGAVWGWPAVLLAVKPTFAPLALIAAGRRSMWIAGAVVGLVSLIALPLWLDYFAVIRNTDLGLGYSVLNVPMVLIPVIAWISRRSPRRIWRSRSAQPTWSGPARGFG